MILPYQSIFSDQNVNVVYISVYKGWIFSIFKISPNIATLEILRCSQDF